MTEAAFREAMVAQVAGLKASVEMLQGNFTNDIEKLWERTDDRFTGMDKATTAALVATDKANQIALTNAKEAVLKAENAATARYDKQDERISELSRRSDRGAGQGEGTKATLYGIAAIIASAGLIVSIIIQLSH